MKNNLISKLVFILLLGLSIAFAKKLTHVGEGGKVIDRVCTMLIDKDEAETLTKNGYTFYFCSNNCKTTFDKDPDKYACICSQLDEGCDCSHCSAEDVLCGCAETIASSHAGQQAHEHGHQY